MLDKIRIVLVEPSHPGNIGAVARAIKTMGLTQFALVQPRKYPHIEASKRSAGAEDVLNDALVFEDLPSAIQDCHLVFATSTREREVGWPACTPRQAASKASDVLTNSDGNIAILFGRESSGLTNQEMECCRWQIVIPANRDYNSLNLASAVQIIAYEFRLAFLQTVKSNNLNPNTHVTASMLRQLPAEQMQVQGFLQHLEQTLDTVDFIKDNSSSKVLMRKLSRLFNRSELTVEEIQILRGILSAVNEKVSNMCI